MSKCLIYNNYSAWNKCYNYVGGAIKKVIELVTSTKRLEQEAEEDTLCMQGFILEIDELVGKYEGVLHVHDLLAILANTQLALQLVHCIDMGE